MRARWVALTDTVNGEQVSLQLAERGIRLSNDLWVREVRQRFDQNHAEREALLFTSVRPCVDLQGRCLAIMNSNIIFSNTCSIVPRQNQTEQCLRVSMHNQIHDLAYSGRFLGQGPDDHGSESKPDGGYYS
jgi:hypothetical protein